MMATFAHMRVPATITDEDMRFILAYMTQLQVTMKTNRKVYRVARALAPVAVVFLSVIFACANTRVIEIVADHDSRYRMLGAGTPAIIAIPGEELRLRITARKASSQNRDGSI